VTAVRGIEIEELESELEGDIDLRCFLGANTTTFTDTESLYGMFEYAYHVGAVKN